MQLNRRNFLKTTISASLLTGTMKCQQKKEHPKLTSQQLDKAGEEPILKTEFFTEPVKIESIELLYNDKYYFVRTRSTDGAVGIAVTDSRASYLYPMLEKLIIPYFIGKDARNLESLIDGVYVYNSNYKLSGIAFWCCVAWVEFSLLDLLGKVASKSVGELLGGVVRNEVPIYVASGRRNTTPEEEVDLLLKSIEETGAKAVKFRVGGRMSKNADSIPGRTEALIPLARKKLGDEITLYADSNGSYDVQKSIEIGKLLESINAGFFEEPCPFDYLEETKQIADALSIPIACGEQETRVWGFRWMIQNNAVQVVQPDLHYNGGFIRSKRVSKMADLAGIPTTLHITDGLSDVDMLHFASCTPNIGKFQEHKGSVSEISSWYDPPLQIKNGIINVPTGPGLGIKHDAELLRNAKKIV